MVNKKNPKFSSYEEEAEFWDTHDFTDYPDSFKPVEAKFNVKELNKFNPNLTQNINIRVKPEIAVKLHLWAQKKNLGISTLARMWLVERLEEENKGNYSGSQCFGLSLSKAGDLQSLIFTIQAWYVVPLRLHQVHRSPSRLTQLVRKA